MLQVYICILWYSLLCSALTSLAWTWEQVHITSISHAFVRNNDSGPRFLQKTFFRKQRLRPLSKDMQPLTKTRSCYIHLSKSSKKKSNIDFCCFCLIIRRFITNIKKCLHISRFQVGQRMPYGICHVKPSLATPFAVFLVLMDLDLASTETPRRPVEQLEQKQPSQHEDQWKNGCVRKWEIYFVWFTG